VKAVARLSNTKLVMMTTLGQRADSGRSQETGFTCLPKPIRRSELRDCLTETLAEGASAKSTSHSGNARQPGLDTTRSHARILLAEDNITNQLVAQTILKKMGLRCDVAANGQEAVQAITSLPYDLVLMDVHMPTMDGIQATRAVRALEDDHPNRRVPIVAMTASAMKRDRDSCIEAGMDDFIAKPVTPGDLAFLMDRWLQRIEPRSHDAEPAVNRVPLALAPTARHTPIFDEAALLARVMQDRDLARTIVRGFLKDIPGQIDSLERYLQQNDAPAAYRQAHTIKGAAATVSGEALREIADQVEADGRAGRLSPMKDRLPALRSGFDALKSVMEASPLLTEPRRPESTR
jgi:CheY-like chemotaxis protein